MISKLIQKLRDPHYRRAFVASQINIGIPFQIRALMRSREWKQDELAKRAGMLQPRISAMLKPGKTKFNIETLRRLAEAFDVGLMVKFVPFSELAYWSESFRPDDFSVPEFSADPGIKKESEHERAPAAFLGPLSEIMTTPTPSQTAAMTEQFKRATRSIAEYLTVAPQRVGLIAEQATLQTGLSALAAAWGEANKAGTAGLWGPADNISVRGLLSRVQIPSEPPVYKLIPQTRVADVAEAINVNPEPSVPSNVVEFPKHYTVRSSRARARARERKRA